MLIKWSKFVSDSQFPAFNTFKKQPKKSITLQNIKSIINPPDIK